MDDELLSDIRRSLEDALGCDDWQCVRDALDMIKDFQGDFDDEEEYE